MKLAPDVLVAGRYRLNRMLGQGGMGSVWAATHEVTRRKVALKLLRAAVLDRPDLRKRFVREARAASLVEHPNVVRVHDIFELEDGTPIMVLDLLEGETLRALFDRSGALSLKEAANLLLPVVSAAGTAHALGVVHRDLKPENVFVTKSSGVKVLDFGIAKLHGDDAATVTAEGAVLGTPCYMAPEQAFGEPRVDHRADVWAVGAMLYEALSGGRPVEGENHGQVLRRLLEDGIVPLSAVCPDAPADVAELVMRMLTRDSEARLGDLCEAREVLARHADVDVPPFGPPGSAERGEPVPENSASEAVDRAEAPTAGGDTAAPHTLPTEGKGPRRTMIVGALVVLAVSVAAATWRTFSHSSSNEEAAPQSAQAIASAAPVVETVVRAPAPSATTPAPPPEVTASTTAAAPRAARRVTPAVEPPASTPVPSAPPAKSAPPAPTKEKPPPQGGLVDEPPF